MPAPRLIDVRVPRSPDAAVLVLHGGASREGSVMVSPTQLSVLRMIPIARRVVRAGKGRLAVFRLLNTHRGWDTRHTPVQDTQWALEQIRDRLGSIPVGLVGHSLGGRAALLAGNDRSVTSIVALAPWVYATDAADLTGRQVLIVHGDHDRVAPLDRSMAVARSLARNAQLGYITIAGGTHSMLRHHNQYDGYAAAFVAATLLPDLAVGRIPEPVRRVLDGERSVDA
jgi:pimeloyl-ACP methyl ester carboxylesterase